MSRVATQRATHGARTLAALGMVVSAIGIWSSAASPSALTTPGSFRVTAGRDLIRDFDPGDGGFLKAFCAVCGGALYAVDPDDFTTLAVRMGTFDTDPGVRPSYHQWTSSAVAWEPIPDDGLPRYEGRRPAAT